MRAVILLSLASLGANLAVAQADLPSGLDQIAASEISRQKIPGVSAVVVKDDQEIWSTGLGVTSLVSRTPVTPDTLFRLGSGRVFQPAARGHVSPYTRFTLDVHRR